MSRLTKINDKTKHYQLSDNWSLTQVYGKLGQLEDLEEKIVTICGSTKFKQEMFNVAKDLTLEGKIVLMPLVFAHQGDVITEGQKFELDFLHCEKIRLSKEIYIVMRNNYIGSSTKKEIEFATMLDKKINYINFEDGVK